MEKIRDMVYNELMEMMYKSFRHTVNGMPLILSGGHEEHEKKGDFIESKKNSMQRLLDNIDLENISEDDAKKEYMRIKHEQGRSPQPKSL